jgi:hypothetical protein
MSDAPSANTILLTILAIATGFKSWVDYRAQRKAAVATEHVREKLQVDGDAQSLKLDQIHQLVNSEYGIALRIGAAALERIAVMSGLEGDSIVAKAARKMSMEHDQKQIAANKKEEK